jgi:hypothetical protein
MSMSPDWDLDSVIARSRLLKVDEGLAVKKYYEIYRYLKTDLHYIDDFKCTEDSVTRTCNWLEAYANVKVK